MQLNEKKYKRQLQIIKLWFAANAYGVLEAITGFGKTYVAIIAIKRMNTKFPDFVTKVVVPSTKLKEDWTGFWGKDDNGKKVWVKGHIENHNLQNIEVYVVNTYVRYRWECDLLIADECHHYASDESEHFSKILDYTKCTYFLGLTATLNKKERDFFAKRGAPVFDTVTEDEGEQQGYTARSITYNLGIEKTEEDDDYYLQLHSSFNSAFAKFEHNFTLALGCGVGNKKRFKVEDWNGYRNHWETGQRWRELYAEYHDWDGNKDHPWSPSSIGKYAAFFNKAMRERKDFLYNMPSKLETALKVINHLEGRKIITFAETTSFADKLVEKLGDKARAYHTNLKTEIRVDNKKVAVGVKTDKGLRYKTLDTGALFDWTQIRELYPTAVRFGADSLKKEAIKLFEEGKVTVLCTAKALDEGFDVHSIDVALVCSYSGSRRQDIQRGGRSKRIDPSNLNKKAIIINLYVIGTQEEKWLKSKQRERRKAIYVKTIEDINFKPRATFIC